MLLGTEIGAALTALEPFDIDGINPVGSTPEQYAETLLPNIEKYAKLVKISGAKVD